MDCLCQARGGVNGPARPARPRSGLQRPEHAGLVRIGVAVSHIGRTLLQEQLLPQARTSLPKEHWHLGVMLTAYGDTLRQLGEKERAAEQLRGALSLLAPQLAPGDFHIEKTRKLLVSVGGGG